MSKIANTITWQPGVALPPGHAVFGVFDGLHLGHRHLIDSMLACAHRDSRSSASILTFDCDPLSVVAPQKHPKKLMTDAQRIAALSKSGVDYVIVIPFDKATSALDPETFLQAMGLLDNTWELASLHVGVNLHFGAHGGADASDLAKMLPATEVIAHELLDIGGSHVSSTRIRALLDKGDIAQANRLLGRQFCIEGTVVRGDGRGRTIGFPTANIEFASDLAIPAAAVYAGSVNIPTTQMQSDSTAHPAAISIGAPTTFDKTEPTLEAHIVDFNENIYGDTVITNFADRLRPMQKFPDAAALIHQLQKDTAAALSIHNL